MIAPARITVLISGTGTNLKALIQHQSAYHVSHVISNKPGAGGLKVARQAGIPTTVVERSSFPSNDAFKEGVLSAVKATDPTVIVLAGFMALLSHSFVAAFPGKILNIHPSLLPELPGLNTHQRALDAGAGRHGCTVHIVDNGVDTGPRIAQAAFDISKTDTLETLASRVQEREHSLYPWVVEQFALGEISVDGTTLRCSDRAHREASEKGFTIC